jgi:Uri superfamily endonuclease
MSVADTVLHPRKLSSSEGTWPPPVEWPDVDFTERTPDLPLDPGLYRLWMDLPNDIAITVGRLGEVPFPAGRYCYTGSARRGIRARVGRYFQTGRPKHWHIDWLLPYVTLIHIEVYPRAEWTECALNAEVMRMPHACVPVRRFGSSDCRCTAHLVRLPLGTPIPTRTDVIHINFT